MDTTILLKEGPRQEVSDPHALGFPEGPLWDLLGHEIVFGREPEAVAAEYDAPMPEVLRLDRLFWSGYDRACMLAEAREWGLDLNDLVRLDNDALRKRLVREEQSREGSPS